MNGWQGFDFFQEMNLITLQNTPVRHDWHEDLSVQKFDLPAFSQIGKFWADFMLIH
jgi:hypothetical protein